MKNDIIIKWEGPFTANEIRQKTGGEDFGIYQVYGNHRIYGQNVLLYIGKAVEQTFGVRMPQHDDWFDWEENQQTYFLGRFCGLEQILIKDWDAQIDLAEKYLIYHCQSAWNSSGLNININNYEKAKIYNFGNKGSLPHFLPIKDNSKKEWDTNYKEFRTEKK